MKENPSLRAQGGHYPLMGIRLLIAIFSLSIILPSQLFAQSFKVTGVVKDTKGRPIQGVSIIVKGTKIGSTTDLAGRFAITAISAKSTLVFSNVAYATWEESVQGRPELYITMTDKSSDMNDVIVIGYGTQKKRDITGAISSVSAKQIAERQAVSVTDALQGQVPGVQISLGSGAPGASNIGSNSSILIRGIGTLQAGAAPLVIVDGAQGIDMNSLNPNDIQSIEILKDAASASIYGSRSANGVILITTKRGSEGKPLLGVNYISSWSDLSHKIAQTNAAGRRLYDFKRTGSWSTSTDSLNPSTNADNDYQKALTRIGKRDEIDMSVSSGSKNTNFYAGLGYLNEQGIILNSWSKTVRGRFNLDYKQDAFSYGARVVGSYNFSNFINEGNTLAQAIQRPPNFAMIFPDGTLAPPIGGRLNPVAYALLYKNNFNIIDAALYNYVAYNFTPSLKFTVDANVSINRTHNSQFTPAVLTGNSNSGLDQESDQNYWITQAYLNFNKTYGGKHTVTGLLGTSAEKTVTSGNTISGTNYVTEAVTTINSAQTINLPVVSQTHATQQSVFGRIGYSYMGKYILNANMRADASSNFGAQNRWGYFPSASAAWRFSDEKFMSFASKYLTDGKLRVSYGLTGNQMIPPYANINQMTFGNTYYNGISGVVNSTQFGNAKLSWESTTQFNVGTDLTMFGGRFTLTADYYNKRTDNLLYNAPIAYETGYTNMYVNVGSLQNRGVEFVTNIIPIQNKNFSWTINYNMSFNRAKSISLFNNTPLIGTLWLIQPGQLLGNFYGWKANGIYAWNQSNAYDDNWNLLTPVLSNGQPNGSYTENGKIYTGKVHQMATNGLTEGGGDVIWQNNRKDSVIDDNDRQILGNAQPKWIAGLTNTFSYKNLSLSVTFYCSYGAKLYNSFRSTLDQIVTTNVTPDPGYIQGAWYYQGDQAATWYAAKNNGQGNARTSSLFIENASFIRLRNVRLTYFVPSKYSSRAYIKGLSIYAYGINLATWTNYSGWDPEVSFSDPTQMGSDNGSYPKKKEYGLGVNVNF